MENKAVKTETIEDAYVVINLFKELGYKRPAWTENRPVVGTCVFVDYDGDILTGDLYGKEEITLPQLRDLVVLKRNDVGDKNVIDPYYNASLYLDSKGDLFVFHIPTKTWKESSLNGYDQTMQRLKPIAKVINCTFDEKPIGSAMKEYLDPRNGYKLIEAPESEALEPHASEWIEVPEGAEIATVQQTNKINFWKDDGVLWWDGDGEWCKYLSLAHHVKKFGYVVIWQRTAQPEELPFVDDEPSLNDQYAEIEKVREKHLHYKKDISHLDTLDIYRMTELFKPHSCGAHIAKKALCSGQRGHKDLLTDIQDIIDTAERWKEMLIEDSK